MIVSLTLETKKPFHTWCLSVEYREEIPLGFLVSLPTGWKQDRWMPAPESGGFPAKTIFQKDGSGVFGEWTPGERKKNLKEIEWFIRKVGFKVVKRKLTLADLL